MSSNEENSEGNNLESGININNNNDKDDSEVDNNNSGKNKNDKKKKISKDNNNKKVTKSKNKGNNNNIEHNNKPKNSIYLFKRDNFININRMLHKKDGIKENNIITNNLFMIKDYNNKFKKGNYINLFE